MSDDQPTDGAYQPRYEPQLMDTAIPHEPRCIGQCVDTHLLRLQQIRMDDSSLETSMFIPGGCDFPMTGMMLTITDAADNQIVQWYSLAEAGRLNGFLAGYLAILDERYGLLPVVMESP